MQAHPHNDETPGRIDTGREFRETETGSSGNYPMVWVVPETR